MSILTKSNVGMKDPINMTWSWANRNFTTYVQNTYAHFIHNPEEQLQITIEDIPNMSNSQITLRVCLENNLKDFIAYIRSKEFDVRFINLSGIMELQNTTIVFKNLLITAFDEEKGFVCLSNDSNNRECIQNDLYQYKQVIYSISSIPASRINVNPF